MKLEEDAFGQLIWTHYQGKEVFEIWERDDGYISVDLPKTYFSEYENWAIHQKQAMEFVKGRVLDIGCGAGRHACMHTTPPRKIHFWASHYEMMYVWDLCAQSRSSVSVRAKPANDYCWLNVL